MMNYTLPILQVFFVIGKLFDLIPLSWAQVFIPLYIWMAVICLLLIIAVILD